MKTKSFYYPCWTTSVTMYIGGGMRSHKSAATSWYKKIDCTMPEWEDSDCMGMTFYEDGLIGDYGLWLHKDSGFNTLAHEGLHIVNRVLSSRGALPVCAGQDVADEHMCMFLDAIVSDGMELMAGVKK